MATNAPTVYNDYARKYCTYGIDDVQTSTGGSSLFQFKTLENETVIELSYIMLFKLLSYSRRNAIIIRSYTNEINSDQVLYVIYVIWK